MHVGLVDESQIPSPASGGGQIPHPISGWAGPTSHIRVGRSHIPHPGGQIPHPASGWADPTSRIRVGRSVPINVQLKPLALGQELKFLLRSVPNIHIAVEPAAALADVEQRVIAHDPRIILFSGVGIPLVGWDRTRTGLGPRHRSHHHPCWIPPSPMLDPAIAHAGSRHRPC